MTAILRVLYTYCCIASVCIYRTVLIPVIMEQLERNKFFRVREIIICTCSVCVNVKFTINKVNDASNGVINASIGIII